MKWPSLGEQTASGSQMSRVLESLRGAVGTMYCRCVGHQLATVAQWKEQRFSKPKREGSSPSGGARISAPQGKGYPEKFLSDLIPRRYSSDGRAADF